MCSGRFMRGNNTTFRGKSDSNRSLMELLYSSAYFRLDADDSPGESTLRRFQDKVVLITGASMGVGEGLARAFAAEGARVAIAARSADKLAALAKSLPGEALAIVADMSEPEQVRAMVEKTAAHFGRLDILVNNAAVGMYAAAADMDMR